MHLLQRNILKEPCLYNFLLRVLEELATAIFVLVMLIFNEPDDDRDVSKDWRILSLKKKKRNRQAEMWITTG